MQKRILTILACVLVAINLFAFSACDNIEGTFYTLKEAYENGWLTQEELLSIAYHYQGTTQNKELMGENYVPMPLTPSELDEKTEKAIFKTFHKEIVDSAPVYADEEFVFYIAGYYGTYNGCVAVKVHTEGQSWIQVIGYDYVGGVAFYYPYPDYIRIWRQNIE